MLFLLRRLKHDGFMNDKFRKYLAYGFGELLLVIAGILIALQIDNWNDDRKEQELLQSYLDSIARNMVDDLAELETLEAVRFEARATADGVESLLGQEEYRADEIAFLNQFRVLNTAENSFNANSTGLESLKASGVLGHLQGSPLEQIMSDYYDLVSQVGDLEDSMNEKTRAIAMRLDLERPEGLANWEVTMPLAVIPQLFQEQQPRYVRYVNSPAIRALSNIPSDHRELLLLYNSLRVLGQAFIEAVDNRLPDESIELPRTPLEDFHEGIGLAGIIKNGKTAYGAYDVRGATSINQTLSGLFSYDTVQPRDDSLQFDHPGGAEWTSVFWLSRHVRTARPFLDFSGFEKLEVELRGDQGGEQLHVLVKDADYPDDIAPIAVEITLTDDWQVYEIDLAEFAPNDLGRLNTALGLLIAPADEPMAFSIRNARYR